VQVQTIGTRMLPGHLYYFASGNDLSFNYKDIDIAPHSVILLGQFDDLASSTAKLLAESATLDITVSNK